MKYKILFALFAALIFAACDENDEPQTGTYRYTAFISSTPVVEGVIHLDELTSQNVRGRWELNFAAAPRDDVGPQIGSGTLAGTFDGVSLSINLNPEMADNNVFLHGSFQGDTIRGDWNFSGFQGPISQGSFMAQRQ